MAAREVSGGGSYIDVMGLAMKRMGRGDASNLDFDSKEAFKLLEKSVGKVGKEADKFDEAAMKMTSAFGRGTNAISVNTASMVQFGAVVAAVLLAGYILSREIGRITEIYEKKQMAMMAENKALFSHIDSLRKVQLAQEGYTEYIKKLTSQEKVGGIKTASTQQFMDIIYNRIMDTLSEGKIKVDGGRETDLFQLTETEKYKEFMKFLAENYSSMKERVEESLPEEVTRNRVWIDEKLDSDKRMQRIQHRI